MVTNPSIHYSPNPVQYMATQNLRHPEAEELRWLRGGLCSTRYSLFPAFRVISSICFGRGTMGKSEFPFQLVFHFLASTANIRWYFRPYRRLERWRSSLTRRGGFSCTHTPLRVELCTTHGLALRLV